MLIRKIRLDEFHEASNLLREMGKVREEGFQERFIETVQNADYLFVGALHKEQMVGYALAQDFGYHLRLGKKVCRLHDLYVLKEFRNTGVASKLMDTTVSWCKSVDAGWLQWNASKESIGFYEKVGCERLTFDEDTPEFEIEFQV